MKPPITCTGMISDKPSRFYVFVVGESCSFLSLMHVLLVDRFYSSNSSFVHSGVDRPGLEVEAVSGQKVWFFFVLSKAIFCASRAGLSNRRSQG